MICYYHYIYILYRPKKSALISLPSGRHYVLTPSATVHETVQDKLAPRSQIPRCFTTRTLLADRFRPLASSGPFKVTLNYFKDSHALYSFLAN